MKERDIIELVKKQPGGHSLARPFYHDPDIYEREIERIFLKTWLYAGHQSEIPAVGDWMLFEVAGESVIVVRSGEDEINALLNVCRHRGSRICEGSGGCAKVLRCPYHGWSYDLRGRLLAAAHMKQGFDRAASGLKSVHLALLDGMMFVNFADEPTPFERVSDCLGERLRPYRLDRARVAHRENYPIASNWKLALENYAECYHCAPSHPEYSRSHSLSKPGERTVEINAQVLGRAADCGLSDRFVNDIYLDAPGFGADCQFDRYALWPGFVTGSRDGKPLAPLLGDIRDYDGGATDLQIGPVSYGLMYCDHVVIYRFTPRTVYTADCDITWLVREDAVEGRDYDRGDLIWLWDHTTHEDKTIIERNQRGVNSRFYTPGPLSTMEDQAAMFLEWYLHTMKQADAA